MNQAKTTLFNVSRLNFIQHLFHVPYNLTFFIDLDSNLFTMVPADPYVIEVFSGSNGLLTKAKKGTILMDCSTVHPNTSKKLLQLSNDAGVDFLDTPVAGAVPAANAGYHHQKTNYLRVSHA
uniref:3-hydroxyisobutyrate dehydrogenase n=1 Tax=Tetranychus urticae TaxID=32264 RepID=T1KPV2_TETUR